MLLTSTLCPGCDKYADSNHNPEHGIHCAECEVYTVQCAVYRETTLYNTYKIYVIHYSLYTIQYTNVLTAFWYIAVLPSCIGVGCVAPGTPSRVVRVSAVVV